MGTRQEKWSKERKSISKGEDRLLKGNGGMIVEGGGDEERGFMIYHSCYRV